MVTVRGAIWWVDFGEPHGAEPGYERPAIIVQDDFINQSRIRTTVVVPLTTQLAYQKLTGNVLLSGVQDILPKPCLAQCHLIQALARKRLVRFMGMLPVDQIERLDLALMQTLGLLPDSA